MLHGLEVADAWISLFFLYMAFCARYYSELLGSFMLLYSPCPFGSLHEHPNVWKGIIRAPYVSLP